MSERLNLADDLRAAAVSSATKTFLMHEGVCSTFSEVNDRANRVASGLFKLGVRKSDRVAFAIGNHLDFVAVHYGVLRLGAVSVPLNPGLKASELRPYLADVAPRAIITEESAANEIMSAGPFSAPVFVIGKHATARPFEQVLGDGEPPEIETDASDTAVLAYTSGTAGSSKAAILTHGNLAANIEQMLEIPLGKTEPDDIVLGVLPLFHIYGLNVVIGLSLRQKASVLLLDRFDPEGAMREISSNGVTIIVGAPPMFISWLTMPAPERFDVSKVRFAISGASALPPEVIPAFASTFGIEIWEGYGLTETSPTLSTTRMAEQRAGSVGKPVAGMEVRLVDPTGAEVAVGDPGEIWVRGPNVFKGYWAAAEATEAAFASDWFRTGDLAYRDEDGYLWLVDRKKELIIVSGFNVYPREVEHAINEHPAVADCAVLGVAHPRQGEAIKAFVVLKQGSSASEEDLIVHCTKRLARFKVPSEFEFVNELPRLASGKVLKRMLRPKELGPNA